MNGVAGELDLLMREIGARARKAARAMALADPSRKTAALRQAAAEIRAARAHLLEENAKDLILADRHGLTSAMRDRLLLDERRIESMALGLEDVASLPDPIGTELQRWTRPNGLDIARVRVPL